jgi:hypothetical protein
MGNMSVRTTWGLRAAIGAMLLAVGAAAGVSAMRSGEARSAIPAHGNLFQSGTLVGWASGARISARDSSLVEFDQIEHARQLAQQSDFEYGGLKLRISQVLQVDYVKSGGSADPGGSARPDKTLVRVTAKIQPPR